MATSFKSEIWSNLNKGKGEYSNINSPYIGKLGVKHAEYKIPQQAIGYPPNRFNQIFSFYEKDPAILLTCKYIFK